MSHPFTKKGRFIILYALVWLVLTVVQILILRKFQDFSWTITITESIISNLSFGLLGMLAWYPTRYIPFQRQNPIYSLSAHIVAGMLIIFLWLLSSMGFMSLLFPDEVTYQQVLSESLFWRIVIGCMTYLVLVLVYYLIMNGYKLQEKAKQEERLRSLVRESELNALKSQINPHFLFNSLNSISALTMTNPDEAREMIIKLSDFLRYSLKHSEHDFVSMKEEVGRMKDYLAIEKIRFGEKLHYHIELGKKCEPVKVPTMILQPLFENAIKHGVYESVEPVSIEFACTTEGEHLKIVLRNDFDPELPNRRGTGIGLQNVKQRIELSYKGEGTMKWERGAGQFIVSILIPRQISSSHDTH